MIDKNKTSIDSLLKNPKNGKYLKVAARKGSCHRLNILGNHVSTFYFSDGPIFSSGVSSACKKIWR